MACCENTQFSLRPILRFDTSSMGFRENLEAFLSPEPDEGADIKYVRGQKAESSQQRQ
jgi:hypothetical protein